MKTYYETLGVSEAATPAEIKAAFRKHAKACHPDTHPGDKAAEERFKAINEAYVTLGDEGKRGEYDQRLRGATQPKQPAEQKGAAPDFGSMNFGDMFGSIFDDMEQGNASKQEVKAEPKQGNSKKDDPLNVDDIFSKFMGFKP